MANYWETGMAQTYKARTQQDLFKRSAEKRAKWAKMGSKLGGLLFGPIGDIVGAELGTMWGETRDRGQGVAGSGREDIYGGVGSDQWFQETRKETLQGIEDIGMDRAIEKMKKVGKMALNYVTGGISGGVESAMGGGEGGGVSSLLSNFGGGGGGGGGTSVPAYGDFSADLMGGNYGANMASGGGGGDVSSDLTSKDSILGRAMYNENEGGQINEAALKEAGEGWWIKWKTGQLTDEEKAWVEENYGMGQ